MELQHSYKIEQLIDLIAQRRYIFSYDGKSYGPELRIGKGLTIYTRGSHYAEGTPIPRSRFEHQARYLDFWLSLVGVTTLRTVVVDNAWNLDHASSVRSIADGRAKVRRKVE